jgi:hypothetical protein
MPVYFVILDRPSSDLDTKLPEVFPDNHYKLSHICWAVLSDQKTASSLRKQLGLGGGVYGRVVVVKSAGTAGWFPKSLWEWLAAREED